MGEIERLASIGLINLIVFYRTLFFGYVGDDVERSERQEPKFKNTLHRWWIQFIGLRHIDSMVAHLITLLTHTACCMMIYLALGRNNLSFLTALLFAINPVNTEGSIWISGRNYVTSSILGLAMWMFPAASWVFYMLTSHFAVNAWFLPLVFLGTKHWYMVGIIPLVWLIDSNNRNTLNRKLWETGGLKTTNSEMRAVKPKKFIPFIKTYIYYFALCIFPWNLGLEHGYLRGFGTNKTDNEKGYKLDWIFWIGLIVFLTVAGLSIYAIFKGWTPLSWGLFWFTINIAMFCNFVTYMQQVATRYAYLANIGLTYALASVIIHYPIVITAFLIAYLVRLIYIQEMYLNDWWAVEYTIREFKKTHYMWLMRGVKKFMQRDHLGAMYDFNEAYQHKPYDLKVLFNLATTYFILGDVVKAREFLDKAKNNVYDELEDAVAPSFKQLDELIITVEQAKARGETSINIDLSRVMIVK